MANLWSPYMTNNGMAKITQNQQIPTPAPITFQSSLSSSYPGFVTAEMQKMKKIGKTAYSLLDIIENPDIRNLFPKNEFPSFEKTNEGYFYQPVRKVVSNTNMGIYYIKWFAMDQNFNISHDHNYKFTKLNPHGYFMKVNIPRTSDQIMDFEVCFVTPVQMINVQGAMRCETLRLDQDISANQMFFVQGFTGPEYPALMSMLMKKEEFIKEYLECILES